MGSPPPVLSFRPVDLATGLPLAICFWRDAFACSFRGERAFDEAEYLDWLRPRLARDPWLAVHVHHAGQFRIIAGSGWVAPSGATAT